MFDAEHRSVSVSSPESLDAIAVVKRRSGSVSSPRSNAGPTTGVSSTPRSGGLWRLHAAVRSRSRPFTVGSFTVSLRGGEIPGPVAV